MWFFKTHIQIIRNEPLIQQKFYPGTIADGFHIKVTDWLWMFKRLLLAKQHKANRCYNLENAAKCLNTRIATEKYKQQ